MIRSQLITFLVGESVYAIDVMRVQEVTSFLPMTKIPIAPESIAGLINLRGQIATAIGLGKLFDIENREVAQVGVTVICKVDGTLLSLLVDSIGDVIEITDAECEAVPETVKQSARQFLSGVYKSQSSIVSIIDIEKLNKLLSKNSFS